MALNKHTDKLKVNVEEQLERLVRQLEDLENYRCVSCFDSCELRNVLTC